MKLKHQMPPNAIDVANWEEDSEFSAYPEGSRVKKLIYSPIHTNLNFLQNNYPYLFKHSHQRYPDEYWSEVIAYRIGVIMDVTVPPTFVAFDSNTNTAGSLAEWFTPKDSKLESISGGDIMQQMIKNYDRKKGEKHNFLTMIEFCKNPEKVLTQVFDERKLNYSNDTPMQDNDINNWLLYWSKIFTFDALIGNIDRHQDNWIILLRTPNFLRESISLSWYYTNILFSPAFDNGASLGREIRLEDFPKYNDEFKLKKYISGENARHHIKWHQDDTRKEKLGVKHGELLLMLCEQFPEARQHIIKALTFDYNKLEEILEEMVQFDVPTPLSEKRANFMLKLLQARHTYLLELLEAK